MGNLTPFAKTKKVIMFSQSCAIVSKLQTLTFLLSKGWVMRRDKKCLSKVRTLSTFFYAGFISAVVNNIEIMFGLTDRPFLRSSFEQIINRCPLHTPLAHLPKCTLFASPLKNNLHNLCFSFLQDITAISREIEHNAYAKFWGANKVHYHNEFHLIF